jgi:cold shock CspA family protein
MRQQGHIKEWKDDKGFGFVEPMTAGTEQAFVHINSFLNRERRPVNGDLISYEAVQDFQKRWQAQAIRYVDEQPAPAAPGPANGPHAPQASSGSASALPILRVIFLLLVLAAVGVVARQLLL